MSQREKVQKASFRTPSDRSLPTITNKPTVGISKVLIATSVALLWTWKSLETGTDLKPWRPKQTSLSKMFASGLWSGLVYATRCWLKPTRVLPTSEEFQALKLLSPTGRAIFDLHCHRRIRCDRVSSGSPLAAIDPIHGALIFKR
jgi:hypothetical protein